MIDARFAAKKNDTTKIIDPDDFANVFTKSYTDNLKLSSTTPNSFKRVFVDGEVKMIEEFGSPFFQTIDNDKFSGMNGLINERPYIVLNSKMNTERNRSTIVHELAHLMFVWPEDMGDKEIEKMATAISGAFLFPKLDAVRELGIRRTAITRDMVLVAIEYGISMMLLVKRAEISRIISTAVAKDFYIKASQFGWRTAEPSRIEREKTLLFEQLVYRAVNEEEISVQRGAELLKVPYNTILAMYHFNEV